MKRIETAVARARYEEIKAILTERGQWEVRNLALVHEAIGQAEGYRGGVLLLDTTNQIHGNFFKEHPEINPEAYKLYHLNHAARLAE